MRKSIDFPDKDGIELIKTIECMAANKNWSFSYMSYVLLQYAVKEKLRKKKPAKESST